MKKTTLLILLLILSSTLICSGQLKIRLPDLVITKITKNKNCNLVVVVKNSGPGMLPDSAYTKIAKKEKGVAIYIDGKLWGSAALASFDKPRNLKKPGGQAAYITTYRVGIKPIHVRAVVDVWNQITEANEQNNQKVMQYLSCKSTIIKPKFTVHRIKTFPNSPARLTHNQTVKVTFYYEASEDVYIGIRPFSGKLPTPHCILQKLTPYKSGKGKGSSQFKIIKGPGRIDSIRIQMRNTRQTKILYKKSIAVDFKLPDPPRKMRMPKRIILDFVDAYLVYSPKSQRLQVVTERERLNYGKTWIKAKVMPHVYDLREKSWQGYFWRVNTLLMKVMLVSGATFGRPGGKTEELTNIRVQVIGRKRFPSIFYLRFNKASLLLVPSSKSITISARSNGRSYRLADGSMWSISVNPMKTIHYSIAHTIWFLSHTWLIDLNDMAVYRSRTSGSPAPPYGQLKKYKMKVRVEGR